MSLASDQSKRRILTGITTTGTPHLGNYVGAIRPAIRSSQSPNAESFFFLADYHALIKCDDPHRLARSRMELAATWLACGLDPNRVTFYRQSDVPEILELYWLLSCVTSKGLMNRAHAYKAACDANTAADDDMDAGVTIGLFSYPVLMAADILLFAASEVPVGQDQAQHIEMARAIALRFNNVFGDGDGPLTIPVAVIDEQVATLPGLDGRKMSKSYDNVVPLFEGGSEGLWHAISKIITDSRLPGQSKDPDVSPLVKIFGAFATQHELLELRQELLDGLGWGDAKRRLFSVIDREIGPLRAKYEELIANSAEMEKMLRSGAERARSEASKLLKILRPSVGLASMVGPARPTAEQSDEATANSKAAFKQYRVSGGVDQGFAFKLLDDDGRVLLESFTFDDPRTAGECIRKLIDDETTLILDAPVRFAEGVTEAEIRKTLQVLRRKKIR